MKLIHIKGLANNRAGGKAIPEINGMRQRGILVVECYNCNYKLASDMGNCVGSVPQKGLL